MTFHDLEIPTAFIAALNNINITSPTPIQVAAIPPALQGRDILASSPTGSGKTLAFLLPLMTNLLNNKHSTALILTPTRELAMQVRDTLIKLLPNRSVNFATLIGGEPITNQFLQLKKKPRVIIGTPGRITDHLMRKTLQLSSTSFLVLDETDRMLEMGFSESLDLILSHLPESGYQTFMFSATLPPFIIKLAEKYLRQPERITLAGDKVEAPQIAQEVAYIEPRGDKFARLLTELTERIGTVIVFVKTKSGAEELAIRLQEYDHKVAALHGDLRQHKRDRTIRGFRSQKYRIMVATDVASRGLDIPHVQHVINYDIPQAPEDYKHRIGRTGRAGATGTAISFVASDEIKQWKIISKPNGFSTEDRYTRTDEARNSRSQSSKRGGGASRDNFGRRDSMDKSRQYPPRRSGVSDDKSRHYSSRQGTSADFYAAKEFSQGRRNSYSDDRFYAGYDKAHSSSQYSNKKDQGFWQADRSSPNKKPAMKQPKRFISDERAMNYGAQKPRASAKPKYNRSKRPL